MNILTIYDQNDNPEVYRSDGAQAVSDNSSSSDNELDEDSEDFAIYPLNDEVPQTTSTHSADSDTSSSSMSKKCRVPVDNRHRGTAA